MMSKQINFFYIQSDLSKILEFFFECNAFFIKNKVFNLNDIKVVDNFENNDFISITNEGFVDNLFYRFIEKQKYYLIDLNKSNVIEFSNNYPKNNIIEVSRFYATNQYYENGDYYKKNEKFVKFSDKIYKDFKKKLLIKDETTNDWWVTHSIHKMLKLNQIKWRSDLSSLELIV